MPASTCAGSIKGRMMRITRNDRCGNFLPTSGGQTERIITKGFIKIDVKPAYEDGDEITLKNADGDLCINERADPNLKRVELGIDLCKIDPRAMEMISGARLLGSGSPVTGTGNAFAEGPVTARFGLEVWTLAVDVSGVENACTSGLIPGWHWVLPHIGGAKLGDFTIENDALTVHFDAETHAVGPDWIGGSNALIEGDHLRYAYNADAPPAAICGTELVTL